MISVWFRGNLGNIQFFVLFHAPSASGWSQFQFGDKLTHEKF